MTNTKAEVFRIIQDNCDRIRGLGVRRLGLFGSFAAGTTTPQSDVDFVVDLETKSFDAYMDLKSLLEEKLQRPVDLVLESAIKPRLRRSIMEELIDVPGL